MSQLLHDSIEKGFATRITNNEKGQECVSCKNIFSTGDKVYRINKTNGTTIQCTSLHCFREQGGKIDEYQINTVIGPKPQDLITAPSKQDADFESKVIQQYHHIHGIEEILWKNFKGAFEGENPAKLGMYMKMIDDNLKNTNTDQRF